LRRARCCARGARCEAGRNSLLPPSTRCRATVTLRAKPSATVCRCPSPGLRSLRRSLRYDGVTRANSPFAGQLYYRIEIISDIRLKEWSGCGEACSRSRWDQIETSDMASWTCHKAATGAHLCGTGLATGRRTDATRYPCHIGGSARHAGVGHNRRVSADVAWGKATVRCIGDASAHATRLHCSKITSALCATCLCRLRRPLWR
jgi:hypothetical protein